MPPSNCWDRRLHHVTAKAVAFAVLTLTHGEQLIEWDCCNALSPLLSAGWGQALSDRPRQRWNDLLSGLAVGRSKRTRELTSSIVPQGTSVHHLVELEFPPIAFDPERPLGRRSFSGPSEFSAINPDAMHNHGQPSSQCNDCLFHPPVPGDLHRPGLEPRPFCRT